MFRRKFTLKEETFILENRLKMPSGKIGQALGCSKSKVQNFLRKKNLKLPKEIREKFRIDGMKGRTTFSKEQTQFIKQNYLTMPVKKMSEKIGKSTTGIQIRLRQLDLVIPKEIIEKRKKESQIQPGTPGWNKGLKQKDYMSPQAIKKSAKTRFKKGFKPHNTAEKDGTISIRHANSGLPYKYIRISLGNWKLYQKHLWEKENGPIPKNHCLWFKNGNSLDCRLENLELITRAENLRRNWHNYPQNLKRAIKLTNKIKTQL